MLTDEEKKLLSIILRVEYDRLVILKSNGIEMFSYNDIDYDCNSIFYLAEKLGVEI